MAVINILKNGTVVKNMSEVTVPKEVVEAVARIAERKKSKRKENDNGA